MFTGEDILPLLPDFALDEVTTRFFGEEMMHQLKRDEIDAVHLAIELWDFGDAILRNRPPEVDGHLGMTAVAAILGVYEFALLGLLGDDARNHDRRGDGATTLRSIRISGCWRADGVPQ